MRIRSTSVTKALFGTAQRQAVDAQTITYSCLIGAAATEDSLGCRSENSQVEEERPVADVLHVECGHLVKRQFATPFDLPQTRDAGPDAGARFGPIGKCVAHSVGLQVFRR